MGRRMRGIKRERELEKAMSECPREREDEREENEWESEREDMKGRVKNGGKCKRKRMQNNET